MKYDKPHLDYNKQVQKMIDRGLDVPNRAQAVAALKRIGYYRLSAYTYPLRLPGSEPKTRRSEFREGSSLQDALALYSFDEKLRTALLSGLQQLEVALRVQIAYNLGKQNMFGHLDTTHLKESECSLIIGNKCETAYEKWLEHYSRQQSDAKYEDYVKHFILNYDGKLPIWVATEFMSFGQLTKLYGFLQDKEATKIAKNLGVIVGRDLLSGWLRALNTLRNLCAHNARIWNRATVFPPTRPAQKVTPTIIQHLSQANNERIYFLAALIAYLLIQADPNTAWPAQFRTAVRKFVPVSGMTAENTMGFPDNWESFELWKPRAEANR